MMPQVVEILYIDFGQKMLGFGKVTSRNLNILKLPVTSAIWNSKMLFVMKFDSVFYFFVKKIYHTKNERGGNLPCVRQC